MAYCKSDSSDSEPTAGPSGVIYTRKFLDMVQEDSSDEGSDSESDVNAFSETYNPMKALYSDNVMIPVRTAPMYENLSQFEASFSSDQVLPVGRGQEVKAREEKKACEKEEYFQALVEKNKARFKKFEQLTIRAPQPKVPRNVFTRQQEITGPLSALKRCLDNHLKVKVMIRHATGIRGVLHGYVAAFDKHWNLLLMDVVEVYRRQSLNKFKVAPEGGRPVDKGTADFISPIPEVRATSVGNSQWECARAIPQMMVRGEHVVTINIIDQ